ncbi:MAG: alpha/beta hydrolase [Firmicutes bacterium]|nr:alpha/beta hydrolase [Bacillota bacterium]
MDYKKIAGAAIGATAVAAAAAVTGAYVAYKLSFRTDREAQTKGYAIPDKYTPEQGEVIKGLMEEMKAIEYEDVWIKSRDGLKLHGKYYHVSDDAPLQIQFHGYNGNTVKDFCGGNKIAREEEHNTLVVEHRAHGQSQGKTITFGVKEKFDCLQWINYAIKRFGEDVKIVLSGVSMGATTVLMASGLDLPKNVVCIVADCGYNSAEEIIRKVAKDRKYPVKLCTPFLHLGALLFGRFNLKKGSAVEAVKKSKVPTLIIHGTEDSMVPYYMGVELYGKCAAEKQFHGVEKAGHGMSYIVDTESYTETVRNFMNKYL